MVAFDLAAEIRDVNVTRPLVAHIGAVPEVLHDLSAAEHSLRLSRHQREDAELRGRQLLQRAVDPDVESDRIELEAPYALQCLVARTVESTPQQDRSEAADQLGHLLDAGS